METSVNTDSKPKGVWSEVFVSEEDKRRRTLWFIDEEKNHCSLGVFLSTMQFKGTPTLPDERVFVLFFYDISVVPLDDPRRKICASAPVLDFLSKSKRFDPSSSFVRFYAISSTCHPSLRDLMENAKRRSGHHLSGVGGWCVKHHTRLRELAAAKASAQPDETWVNAFANMSLDSSNGYEDDGSLDSQ